jgi:hypothetical protein
VVRGRSRGGGIQSALGVDAQEGPGFDGSLTIPPPDRSAADPLEVSFWSGGLAYGRALLSPPLALNLGTVEVEAWHLDSFG